MSIGDGAFEGCSDMTSVVIGGSVKTISSQAFANCPELTDITCYAVNVPSTQSDAFKGSYIEYATLHVSPASIDGYKSKTPWNSFGTIIGLDGTLPDPPETPKCATPTINYQDGELTFSCETEDVSFTYEITTADVQKGTASEVQLTKTYTVSVYATKEGYENSDVATMDIKVGGGIQGDVNQDGVVSIADAVNVVNIIMKGETAAPALDMPQE